MKSFFVLAATIMICNACSSDSDSSNSPTEVPSQYSGYDIFAIGYSPPTTSLYKNFDILYRADQFNADFTVHFSVIGNDIYQGATKRYRTTSDFQINKGGCILKNGVELYSDTGEASEIRGLSVSDGDVYYLSTHCGLCSQSALQGRPKVWKNGVMLYPLVTPYTGLPNANSPQAFDMSTVGSDVYVGGYEEMGGYSSVGYWQNEIYIEICTSNYFEYFQLPLKFYVAPNGDIYEMFGERFSQDSRQSRIFKNGVEVEGIQKTESNNIFIDFEVVGDDLYIIGQDNELNAFWKNGTKTYLPDDRLNDNINDDIDDMTIVDGKIFIGLTLYEYIEGSLISKSAIVEYIPATNTYVVIGTPEGTVENPDNVNGYIGKIQVIKK